MVNIDIYVREATIESLDLYISLLEEIGTWLWHKGVKQWEPGVHHKNYEGIRDLVTNGHLILAFQGEELAGGCILSEIVPEFWPNDSESLALYSLVVARFAAGQGVGGKIIQHCLEVGKKRNKSSIRLDCWDGNDFLKAYYQNEGFEMFDAVQEKDYWIRPFEKQIEFD